MKILLAIPNRFAILLATIAMKLSGNERTKMQYESSITHRENLNSGLKVEWIRTSAQDSPDNTWDVVAYSDGSRWLFDNASGNKLTLLGAVSDGLNTCEILETEINTIIALYTGGIETFYDREAWIESLPNSDKPEAEAMLAAYESR